MSMHPTLQIVGYFSIKENLFLHPSLSRIYITTPRHLHSPQKQLENRHDETLYLHSDGSLRNVTIDSKDLSKRTGYYASLNDALEAVKLFNKLQVQKATATT